MRYAVELHFKLKGYRGDKKYVAPEKIKGEEITI